MKKLKRRLFLKLPDFIVRNIIRKRIKIPKLPVPEVTFKIATEKEELEQAYRLLYKTYLNKGFIIPNTSELYLTPQHAHPLTATFVGKVGNKVIITMTLFPDTDLGLPMDTLYNKDLASIRSKGRFIAEVGSLASDQEFRQGTQILPLMITNIMYRYGKKHFKVDDMVIVVNPLHAPIYKHLIMYKQFGKIKPYHQVNGNLAVPMHLDTHVCEQEFKDVYFQKPEEKDLHRFFCVNNYKNFQLPSDQKVINVFNREFYKDFIVERTQLHNSLTVFQKYLLFHQYDKFEQTDEIFDKSNFVLSIHE